MEDGQATESATNMGDAQKISLGVGEAKSARSCSRREQTQTPLCEWFPQGHLTVNPI